MFPRAPFLALLASGALGAAALAVPVLRVDIDDAETPGDTAPEHNSYLLSDETLSVPPFTIDVNPAGGALLDDVHHATPADNPALPLAALYRDAVFAAGSATVNFYRTGLDAQIGGLVPGKRYTVSAWSFDSAATGARTSDWSAVGLGGPVFAVNDYVFDGATAPGSDAANRFTVTALADETGRLTLRGRQSASTTIAQVFLNGFAVDEHPDQAVMPALVLALDVNRRGGGAAETQPGFQELALNGAGVQTTVTRTFGALTVTLSAIGSGASMDDRLRTTGPPNNGPFTESHLLRDFVFASTGSQGLDLRLQGLTAGASYLLEVWSFDTESPGVRVSDWTVNGAPLWDDWAFDGNNEPLTNNDYKMAGVFTANAAGELLIAGRTVSGSPAVFLDAVRVSALAPAPVVDLGRPILSEFLADNESGIVDEDGDNSDWIEIWNTTPNTIDLAGWHLTDSAADKTKWTFPAGVTLAAQARLIVWASGKDRRVNPTVLHTSFSLDKASGGYLALVAPNGTTVATEFTNIPSQRPDTSYGLAGTADPLAVGYFQPPTPGTLNGTPVPGFVADTVFDLDRGFYSAPLAVHLTCATAGAEIRYTTDGSEPTTASALYPGAAGVPISTTTVLRAKAFAPPLAPSNTDSQTYIFPAHIAVQPANPPGWPASWGIDAEVNTNDGAGNGTVPADYEMDPQVVNNTVAGHGIAEALAALPVLSLALAPADFHSAGSGIYSNPRSVGDAWERACSIEFLEPGGGGFHTRAGVRIHGNSSRRPYRMQKHSFRLAFRDQYGDGRLNHDLFPDTRVDRFDKLVLRACFTDSWGLVSWDPPRYRPDDATYFRGLFAINSFAAMGHGQSTSRFAHLLINGLYWGVYDISERIDDIFCADHFGGAPPDWDVMGDFTLVKSGTGTAWDALFAFVNANDLSIPANYQQVAAQMDLENFADYYLLHVYGDAEDWPHHNGYAIRNRTVPGSRWRFLVWDQEIFLDNHAIDRLSVNAPNTTTDKTPGRLLNRLRNNAEFRLLFADRAHRHLHGNGALSLARSQQRWQGLADQLDQAIVAESARWGDTADATPYGNAVSKPVFTREADWLVKVAGVKNTWLPSLHNEANTYAAIRKLRTAGFYPNTAPPAFGMDGGNVPVGYALTITAPAGTIYYTLNGSDPREAVTGNPLGTAYTAPVTLNQTATVKARALNGTEWSALTEARFIVGIAASSANLAISELNYHPLTNEEEEFIELVNFSAATIDLSGVHFTAGVTFTFADGALLTAGARTLIVRNAAAFTARYGAGLPIAGTFLGALENSGEEVALAAADESDIFRFTYGDQPPWPAAADGDGRTLVLRSPLADPRDPTNWRSSAAAGGNPGTTDSVNLTGSPLADIDGDGLNALFEHALGTSDTVPSSIESPSFAVQSFTLAGSAQSFLTVTARRNLAADDTRLIAEFSADLATWSSAPTDVVFLGESIAPDGTATLRWRAAQPITPASARQFLRLRATLGP